MVQANKFYGLPSEDASAHLQHFLELCDTIVIKDVAPVLTVDNVNILYVNKQEKWFKYKNIHRSRV
jgi:hypothetical protein